MTQPWEEYTYIPKDSTVTLNCTVADDRTPAWTVKLSSNQTDAVSLPFSLPPIVMTLNGRGFYQLPPEENGTILLLVNMTTRINNGTEIQCVYPAQATAISKTVLIVYGESPKSLHPTLINRTFMFQNQRSLKRNCMTSLCRWPTFLGTLFLLGTTTTLYQ